MSETAVSPVVLPPDHDLRGYTVPKLLGEARAGMGRATFDVIEAVRRVLHVIEGDLWQNPQKYGADTADESFGYQSIGKLSAEELCSLSIGLSLGQARRVRDVAGIIGWEKTKALTPEAIYELARHPDGARAVARAINGSGKQLTVQEVRALIEPYRTRLNIRRAPMNDDERAAYEKRIQELQSEVRRLRGLEKETKRLKEELQSTRDEVADLQSKLYTRNP